MNPASALPVVLWLSAALALYRRRRLRLDEALMGGATLSALAAVVLMTILGCANRLTPGRVGAATAALAAAALMYAFSGRGPARHLAPRARLPLALGAALILCVLVLSFRLYLASALPLDSWDALSYHVPMILRWIQQGNLDLSGSTGPSRYYPWNGELLSAWIALLNKGSLDPVRTAQAYPALWMACAGVVLGRRLGGKVWGAAVGVALLGLPIAVLQAGTPYVDVFYGAFWVCAAAEALCWDRGGRLIHLALWGAAFGLALGAKGTVYFQAPLVLQILITLAARPRRRRRLAPGACAAAAAALAGGAFCYARNWILEGNPIYPYTLKLAGRQVFSGIMQPQELLVTVEQRYVSSTAGWLSYPFHEYLNGKLVLDGSNGFGALFAAGWALFPLALWRALRRRDWGALGFLLLLPGACFFFIKMQPTRQPRYMVFLPAMPIAGLAYLLYDVKGRLRSLALAGWSFGVAVGLVGVLGGLGEDSGVLRGWKELRAGRPVEIHQYYRWQYGALAEAWEALDGRLKPGDVVAVNYGELELPLSGLPPRGRIFEIGHALNDFPQTLWSTTDEGWLKILDDIDARFLLIWSPAWYPDVGKAERSAIAKFPDRFRSDGHWQSGGMGVIDLYEVVQKTD